MTDGGGNYASGAGGGGGGNDWELVSLTASTYAAAPGPVPPLLLDAHEKTEELPPTPPAVFMSQHFSLPAAEAHVNIINGRQEEKEEEFAPAMLPPDDEGATDNLNTPCPENPVGEQDGGSLTQCSDLHKDQPITLGLDGGNQFADAGNATMLCFPAASAATDGIIDSASLPAHAVHVAVQSGSGVACVAPIEGPSSRIPRETQAWWNKTFRFPHHNSKEPLTFGFVFPAATIVEFNVDSEKTSCGVSEPLALGQVKVSMLGGSPVAQG